MAPPTPPVPLPDPDLWPAVRRVLDALDDLPPAERDAAVEAACRDAGHGEALAREVRAALAAEAAAGTAGFLGAAAAHDAAHLLSDPATDVLGQRVGPWRIAGLLGEGGMGTVYRAERADGAYQQQAALKVIGRGLAPPSLVERFRRERQILAGLRHPHVARLLDGGVSDAGQPYFAMELVEGQPITTYARDRTLSVDARVELLRQTAEAVAYAHRRLVVHRDLKPTNVLVTEDDDGTPRAVLLDFGIAKLLDDDGHTRTAAPMTPEYGAPEQVAGGEITTATDVYALGVLLYELLAGHRPFDFSGLTPTGIERALATQPPPPSAQAPGVSRDLDAIVSKALAPQPERRYASAASMGDDLDRYLGGLPVAARPPTAWYRASSFVRRHPAGVAAAAAFVLLLVGFSAFTAVQATRLAAERDRAEAETATTQAVSDFVLGLFRASNPGEARGTETTAGELLARGVERTARLDAAPEVRAEVLRTLGTVTMQLGDFDGAGALLDSALALARVHSSPADLLLALGVRSGLHLRAREPAQAEALAREAIALSDATPSLPDSVRAAPRNQLAMVLLAREAFADAEALLTSTRETTERLRPGHPLHMALLSNLGTTYRSQGDLVRGEGIARDVLALRRQVQGDDHPDTASALRALGLALEDQGKTDEAIVHLREALAIQRQVLPRPHRNTVDTIRSLSRLVSPAEAVALLRDAVEQVEMLYPAGHRSIEGAQQALAEAEARARQGSS